MGLVKWQPTVEHGLVAAPSPEQAVSALQSTDATIRRQAVRVLSAEAQAIAPLCAHLSAESSLSVRSLIFTSLIAQATPEVVEGLLPLLRSEDSNLRNGAVEALQTMPEAVAPYIERLLVDEDSDVRIFVVNVLAALPHPGVPSWLCQVITHDPHVNVCAAALDGLAEVGQPEAIPALNALVDRFPDIAFITFAVDAAIRRISGR